MTASNLTKSQWRIEMKQRLAALTDKDYRAANHRLEAAFFSLDRVRDAVAVMIYYAVNREAATVNLIMKLLAQGRRVALPVCIAGCNLVAKEISNLAEVRPVGQFGLFEPVPELPPIASDRIELAVVPGVAFDHCGNRLGHGKGYYDRFFTSTAFEAYKLGLAYDFQVVERLPAVEHDVKMDAVLTPNSLYEF